MWPCACVRSRSGAGACACACARSRVRAYTRLWRCACVRLASWCILVQGPTAVVCTVSSLDTKMHMQLQTAVCAQGICTQLHAACTAERLQSPMKFIHACRLGLRPIFAAAVPLFLAKGREGKEERQTLILDPLYKESIHACSFMCTHGQIVAAVPLSSARRTICGYGTVSLSRAPLLRPKADPQRRPPFHYAWLISNSYNNSINSNSHNAIML